MKKYKLTNETKQVGNITLHRIQALKTFGNVNKGELGGCIEKESNLSQSGNAWVSDNAWVYGNARVSDNAQVCGNAEVCGDAEVYGNADYLIISPIGSRGGCFTVTFKPKLQIATGCFVGTPEEFETAVKETHGDNQYAREYLVTIEYIKNINAIRL